MYWYIFIGFQPAANEEKFDPNDDIYLKDKPPYGITYTPPVNGKEKTVIEEVNKQIIWLICLLLMSTQILLTVTFTAQMLTCVINIKFSIDSR